MAPEMDKIKRSGEENGHMTKLAILLGRCFNVKNEKHISIEF